MSTTEWNNLIEKGRLECMTPIQDNFFEWFNTLPTPPPYKPAQKVKVSMDMHITTLRDLGHQYFDIIWRDLKLMSRPDAYAWLAGWLDISPFKTHFSMFNEKLCVEAITASIQMLNDNRRLDMDLTGGEPYPFYELIIKT